MSTAVGKNRERQLCRWYRERGYVAYTTKNDGQTETDEKGRRRPSHGITDVIVLMPHVRPALVQVKSTAQGPYQKFGPAERAKLIAEAEQCDAVPLLCWWPPYARQPKFISRAEWPGGNVVPLVGEAA